MPWPNLFWLIVGLDCTWLTGSSGEGTMPYIVLTDMYVMPLLLVTLVGLTTCVRWLLRLGGRLLRPRRLTREERVLRKLRQQARRAAAEYLYPYL